MPIKITKPCFAKDHIYCCFLLPKLQTNWANFFCKLRPQSKILLLSKAFWRWRAFLGTHANGNTLINNISLDLVKVGDDPDHVAASKNWRRKSGINCNYDDRYQQREGWGGRRSSDFFFAVYWSLDSAMSMPWESQMMSTLLFGQFKDTVMMQLDSLRNATLFSKSSGQNRKELL